MNKLRAFSTGSRLVPLFAAVVSIFALSAPLYGQFSPNPVPQQNPRQIADRDLAEREWQLRNIGRATRKDVEVEQPRVTLAQIKKDYEGLQISNNQLLRMLQTGAIDYELIVTAATDIKKRAGRLKLALRLPEPPINDKRVRFSDEVVSKSMKASILSLDALIMKLVSNSIFKDAGRIVDAENSAKARADIDSIIELCGKLRRGSEKLRSASASQ